MCGSATLTTVVSSPSMKVPNITAIAMIHGLITGCSARSAKLLVAFRLIPDTHGRHDGHSWTKDVLRILVLFEDDLHRDALHNFYVISSRVLRWQKAESSTRCTPKAVDVPVKIMIEGVDMDFYRLANTHLLKLGFFEICSYVNVVEVHKCRERLARLYYLTYFYRPLTDDSVCWSNNCGVLQ